MGSADEEAISLPAGFDVPSSRWAKLALGNKLLALSALEKSGDENVDQVIPSNILSGIRRAGIGASSAEPK